MKIALQIVLILLVLVAGVRLLERKSVYYPMRHLEGNPSEIGLDYEEINFYTSDNKKINAWFIPKENARFTVLFSNGNAGNISYRLDKISVLYDLGVNVFIYDYRGYGKSQGFPSEKGIYKDIRGAYRYLVNDLGISADEIILYGESLGGAVAIDLASQKQVRALITEGTFTSAKDMAQRVLPFIPYFLFASRFDNLTKIAYIKCPKLIIHSKNDNIIPFSQGIKLFEATGQPKTFLELKGGHNTAFWDSMDKYKEGLESFIQGL